MYCNIFGKYQNELDFAKEIYQRAVSDLDNPEVTPAKRTTIPVREKTVEIKETEKSNEQPTVIPANPVKPVKPNETELLAQDLTAEDYGYDENADWQLTSGVLDVNDTEQASVADNQVIYGGELDKSISSKEETKEPLKTPENASQEPSTVSKVEEFARNFEMDFWDALKESRTISTLSPRNTSKIDGFAELIESFMDLKDHRVDSDFIDSTER